MKLSHVCLIMKDLVQLRDFYRVVLQLEPEQFKDDYVEFPSSTYFRDPDGNLLNFYSIVGSP